MSADILPESTKPAPNQIATMTAFLRGYTETMQAVTLDQAHEIVAKVTLPGLIVDGMTLSRMLRSAGFNRSYANADRATITYRRRDVGRSPNGEVLGRILSPESSSDRVDQELDVLGSTTVRPLTHGIEAAPEIADEMPVIPAHEVAAMKGDRATGVAERGVIECTFDELVAIEVDLDFAEGLPPVFHDCTFSLTRKCSAPDHQESMARAAVQSVHGDDL